MAKNRFVAARKKKQQRAREYALAQECLQAIQTKLLANLSESFVQEAIDRLWTERSEYRAMFEEWKHLGGLSILNRIDRLTHIARTGTIREKKWLVQAISDIHWVNPPVAILNDSIHYDIPIKVRSLRNTKGRGGQNPYEWVREDKLSVSDGESLNASRAHVKQVERPDYPVLTKWLKQSIKRLPSTENQLTLIEERLNRAVTSGHDYAFTKTIFTGTYDQERAPRWVAIIDPETGFLRMYRNDEYVSTYRDYETALRCGIPAPFEIETIQDFFVRHPSYVSKFATDTTRREIEARSKKG